MSERTRTSKHQGALFWPHIYLTNLTRERYPKLLGMYGSPGKVMKAEKEYIIKALGYHVLCRSEKGEENCLKVQERRHRSEKHQDYPYTKTSAYHICSYTKKKGCTTRKDLTKLSLQFLRWLLFQTDEDVFLSYVKKFPHQVTEKDYGYDHETGKRVMTKQEVVDIKRLIVRAAPQEYKTIPVGYLREVQQALALREVQQALAPQISKQKTPSPIYIRSKKARPAQIIGKTTQKRLQHATVTISKLQEKLRKTEDVLNYYIKDNESLMKDLKKQKWEQNVTEKELKEMTEDVKVCNRDVAYAKEELEKCSLLRINCAEATENLKKLDQDLKKLPKRQDVKNATNAAITSAIRAAGQRLAQPNPNMEAMEKLKKRLEKAKDILRDKEATSAQLINHLVDLFNDVFDENDGLLITALLARGKE